MELPEGPGGLPEVSRRRPEGLLKEGPEARNVPFPDGNPHGMGQIGNWSASGPELSARSGTLQGVLPRNGALQRLVLDEVKPSRCGLLTGLDQTRRARRLRLSQMLPR